MRRTALLLSSLWLTVTAHGQSSVPAPSAGPPSGSEARAKLPVEVNKSFHWERAFRQSFYFLAMQHSARMAQSKTRREFQGPFFGDYADSVTGIHGWRDGDSIVTNYVGHPMQGAITGFIQIQNDPSGIKLQISNSPDYWKSRLRAMAWAAAYSTQFEIGPLSEATLGNVGKRKGTAGYVDLVMTPTAGFGLIVGEDAIDRWLIRRLEHAGHPGRTRFYRMAFNPTRSISNLLRFKHPWYRDSRGMGSEEVGRDFNVNSNASTSASRPANSSSSRDK